MKPYKEMLGKSIEMVMKNTKWTLEEVLVEVLESVMEVERTNFLKYERGGQPIEENKRNGHYKRMIQNMNGRFCLQIPRDRQGLFQPFMLELVKQDSQRMNEFALKLYSQGVSQRGIQDVFRSIFGSHYSPQRVSLMVQDFQKERENWQKRGLEEKYHAIIVDAVHINIRRDTVQKEALYIVMGLKEDYRRDILGIYNIPQESASGWKEVFCDLRHRGVNQVGLFLCDECAGIEKGILSEFPQSRIQFCMIHKMRNLMNKVRSDKKKEIINDFLDVLDIENPNNTKEKVENKLQLFIAKWSKLYPSIKRMFPEEKIQFYHSFLDYPVTIRRMFYTTNWIERLNKEIRKITKHTNSFPTPDSAINLTFMVVQNMMKTYSYPISSFAPVNHLMNDILSQTQFS